jgi:hypothetical protein
MMYACAMKPPAMPAPELLRAALRAGITVGWAPGSGEAYAQVADAEDPRQRAIFEALMSNAYAPDIMYGYYYAGDYSRMQ